MTSSHLLRSLLALFLLAVPLSGVAAAQVDRASVAGIVRDQSSAVVPGATVQVTNTATGVNTSTTSGADGSWTVISLIPGTYRVAVSLQGFQPVERVLRLEVGQRARLDVTLSLTAVGESVTVSATPLLETRAAVVGAVVSQTEITNLPLAIRNWDDLLFTLPGVQGDRYTEQTGTTNAGRTGGVSIHGNRSLQNNFLLDGMDNNSISTNVQELSTQVSRPSIDAIGEFKVVTSPFTAEYGRAAGGAIVVNTKSGTNTMAGTLYGYFRNEGFDSKSYFARVAKLDKAANDQKQFGGNFGGPIVSNRAFFFGDFEGTRISQGVLRASSIMTTDERRGVFSSTVRDPLTGAAFPNNTIPTNRIDPVAAAIAALLPAPNAVGSTNYVIQPNVQDDGERYLGRIDIKASTADSLFARFIYTDRLRFVPGFIGGVLDGTSTSAWGRNFLKSRSIVAGWTRVFSNTMVNEFRASWAQGRSDGQQDPFGNDGMAQKGFKGVPVNPTVAGGIVGIDISGHARLGSPNFMPKYQYTDQFQFLNTATWLVGRHELKVGADIMAPMKNEYLDIPSTRGNLQFSGQYTGNARADFLLGYVRGAELSNVHVVNQRRWAMAYFIQDDFRVNDRLTLNLGLRYDFMSPSYEADNKMANFDPATGGLVFAKAGSLKDRALVSPDWNNVAPRLGAVYQLNTRTVIRGGYGTFYNSLDRIGSEDQLALNPPGLRNINQTTTSTTTPIIFLRDGFPTNYLDPTNIVLSRLLIRAANPSGESAIFHQMSLGFERELGRDLVMSADFVANYGRNIAVLRNLNQPANGNGARPYPNFSHIQWRDPIGTSQYHGVDLSLEKRFSQGYTGRVSYTLSKATDQAPEHLAASSGRPQDTNNIAAWEGPSDFDVRHRLVASAVIELPFGADKRWATSGAAAQILGGWTLSSIFTARSGRPFTVTQGSLEGATWMPNQIGSPVSDRNVARYFDRAAFQVVPAGTFGNTKRNSLVGPGYVTLDLTVQRKFTIAGRYGLSARWDIFNALNRANFGNPNSNITASNAGTISTLAGDPRTMQVSFRFQF